MDNLRKLIDTLKAAVLEPPTLPIVPMQVKAITGESCTVVYGDLELTDVRLKATINGSGNKLLLLPKVGSMVLVGSLTNDLKDLAVLQVDELQEINYEQDGFKLELDTTTGKFLIENQQVGLKGLLQQLTDLLKQFKVYTPDGPSGTPLPDTVASIMQFETSFKQLLK
jgi:hypothetical protein